MIRLDLLNVGLVEETGGILLVLRAHGLERLLVIETGILEGQAIALQASGVRSERPLTQDLLFDTIVRLGARVKEVQIPEFHDETFFAKVVLHRPDGQERIIELDARPSDAIALALRAQAPIYVADEIIDELGLPADRSGRFEELFDEDAPPGPRTVH
jgi:uncharacterized protein